MTAIKGKTIKLKKKIKTGVDEFNRPVYEDTFVNVDNVLIGEPSSEEIVNTLTLTGKKVVYMLAIPKSDQNDWTDTEVLFFGERFRTIGAPVQGIEANIPLDWNKKVKVERYV